MELYGERKIIERGAGGAIFDLVCDRATRGQWAEWLRLPLAHAAGMANAELVDKLLKAGANGSAGWVAMARLCFIGALEVEMSKSCRL